MPSLNSSSKPSVHGQITSFPAESKPEINSGLLSELTHPGTTEDSLALADPFPDATTTLAHSPEVKRSRAMHWVTGFSATRCAAEVCLILNSLLVTNAIQRSIADDKSYKDAQARVVRLEASDPWPMNVSVYASTTQELDAFCFDGGYSAELRRHLASPRTESLTDAHIELEHGLTGAFRIHPQIPISSIGDPNGWMKQINVPRYVLLISGDIAEEPLPGTRPPRASDFEQDLYRMKFTLMDAYEIPDANFVLAINPTLRETEAALRKLSDRIDLPDASEVLIYVTSHGSVRNYPSYDQDWPQGAAEGAFSLRDRQEVTESSLKTWIRSNLADVKHISLVIDTCRSGAWIE